MNYGENGDRVHTMKVLLVDDSALYLVGLRNMLETNGITVLGTACNAREAVTQALKLEPELVLMDVQMPGESGIEATGGLKSIFPALKIVMMTVSENDEHIFKAISAGACGYLRKNISPQEFLAALAGMERGETPLSPGLAAKIMAEFARRDREREARNAPLDPASVLTERQMEILYLLAQGRPYKEIAQTLGLTEAAIKYQMGRITDRLHLENRTQVVAYAGVHFLGKPPHKDS